MRKIVIFISILFSSQVFIAQNEKLPLQALDVFDLEWVSDPQISPDGTQVVYRRNGFDIMKDNSRGNLWIINTDGLSHRKLTSREVNESQASWSPNGDRIAFVSSTDEGSDNGDDDSYVAAEIVVSGSTYTLYDYNSGDELASGRTANMHSNLKNLIRGRKK